jgi:regulator of PEP synthase PpsR (kinase-PPPase family)
MGHKYQINQISGSTGETLDRIFPTLKSQFSNFDFEKKEYVFIRTNRLETMKEKKNSSYSNLEFIKKEIENSKKMFKKYN